MTYRTRSAALHLLIEMLVPVMGQIDRIGTELEPDTRDRCTAQGAAAELSEVVARIHGLVDG